MRYIVSFIFLVIFISGCSAKQYYMISTPHTIPSTNHIGQKTIGIESIELPAYLSMDKVVVQRDDNRIVYLGDAHWAVNMGDDLTNALIFDLQKSLKGSKIFHYPWESRTKIDMLVVIKIKRFIAYKGYVYLDAVVRINNDDKIISLKEPVNMHESSKIVEGMKKAFFAFERAVVDALDDIRISKQQR